MMAKTILQAEDKLPATTTNGSKRPRSPSPSSAPAPPSTCKSDKEGATTTAATPTASADTALAPIETLKQTKKLKKLHATDPVAAEKLEYTRKLGLCYKVGNIDEAIRLFREIKEKQVAVGAEGFNALLSLCSSTNRPELDEIYDHMKETGAALNEAAYTSVIRSRCLAGHPEEGEKLLKEMLVSGEKARLRSYTPLLASYASQGKAKNAFQLYDDMLASGLEATQVEYAAMLRAVTSVGYSQGFLRIVKEMQECIFELAPETLEALEAWFLKAGESCPEERETKRRSSSSSSAAAPSPAAAAAAIITRDAKVNAQGKCSACGHVLQSIELPVEGAKELMQKVEEIVLADVTRAEDWARFKASLIGSGSTSTGQPFDYDIVIDGANVGYFQMNYNGAPPHVNYQQIAWVVDHFLHKGQKPLLVLHERHVKDNRVPPAFLPLVKSWQAAKLLLTVPFRNNDDWFWLYCTVFKGGRTLVVTNDEMRDHHFQMLSQRSFLSWKERHQAYFSFGSFHRDRRNVVIESPPVYSRRIQKQEAAAASSYHFPHAPDNEWLCVQVRRKEGKKVDR